MKSSFTVLRSFTYLLSGLVLLFATMAAPAAVLPVQAATLPAMLNADGTAQLKGFVTAPTGGYYWFQWGAITANAGSATNYANVTPVSTLAAGNQVMYVTNGLSGLSPLTQYHYQLVASNSAGVVYGGEQRFGAGVVAAWGSNSSGQTNVPVGLSNVVAVAGGGNHSLALQQDGTVVAWGDSSAGQTNVPVGLSNVVAVAGGAYHSLALRQDGTVVAWGLNSSGQTNVPAGLSNVVAVAAGYQHSLALRQGGTVVVWGDNSYGQTNVPAGLSNVVAVAASFYYNLALRQDGTVVAWGRNDSGQTDVPAGLSNVMAVAGGGLFSLALTIPVNTATTTTTTLTASPNPAVYNQPLTLTATVSPAGSSGMVIFYDGATAIGTNALNTNSVATWTISNLSAGSHNFTAMYAGSGNYSASTSAVNMQTVSAPVAPQAATLPAKLNVDGTMQLNGFVTPRSGASFWFQWGAITTNASSATNYANMTPMQSLMPVQTSAVGNQVVYVMNGINGLSVGTQYHYQLVASNSAGVVYGGEQRFGAGVVVAWGQNYFGQTNVPAGLSNVVMVAGGSGFGVVLRNDGPVVAWGLNNSGQTNVPVGLSNVVAVASGTAFSLAIRNDGKVVAWGDSGDHQTNVPVGLSNVVAVVGGGYHSLALRNDGTVVAWGRNKEGQTNVPVGLSNVVAVAAGQYHSLVLRNDGTVMAWGTNNSGQINVPVGLSNVVAIAGGFNHSLALRNDGTVVAWGDNSSGQTNIPVGLSNVVAVAGIGFSSLALTIPANTTTTTTTTLTASPNPAVYNQPLTLTATVSPAGSSGMVIFYDGATAIGTNTLNTNSVATWTISNISAGNHNFTAMYAGGGSYASSTSAVNPQTVSAPVAPRAATLPPILNPTGAAQLNGFVTPPNGASYWFQWGAITTNASSATNYANVTPAQTLAAGSQVVYVTNGLSGLSPLTQYHYQLVASNSAGVVYGGEQRFGSGAVLAWGNNDNSQTNVPAGLSNVVAVAAGYIHSLVLRNDGTVAAWGNNAFGQANMPAGLSNAVAVAAGYYHNLALRNDGTVVAWGDNSYGQTTVPVGLSNVVAVAGGYKYSLALRNDGTVVAWGQNASGQTNVPAGLSKVLAVAGGANHALALTIPFNTTTTLAASPNPAIYNQPFTLTATVSPVGASGMVIFYDGATAIGTNTLNTNNVATWTVSNASVGSHNFMAAYTGAGLYLGSTSSNTTQTVNQAETSVRIVTSPAMSVYGQPVVFTATVNPEFGGTPSGTVIFAAGTNNFATNTLVNGMASTTNATLPVGVSDITASYSGDTNFANSTWMTNQWVIQASTTNVLTSSVNPSVSGQSVTFTTTISAVAPGAGTPTGDVVFFNGTNNLGTNALMNGVASLTNSILLVGTNLITVVYAGDTNFTGSTSLALTQIVISLTDPQVLMPSIVDKSSPRFRQTGLMQQTITVSNVTSEPYSAVRVTLQLSPAQKQLGIIVYNATGTNTNGDAYLESDFAVPPHGSVTFTVEYFVPDRTTIPNPTITVELVSSAPPAAIPAGTPQKIVQQAFFAPGNAFLIGFQTVKDAKYYVLYSTNLLDDWIVVQPAITGTGSQIQWLDQGPPQTVSAPSQEGNRFYRVIRAN